MSSEQENHQNALDVMKKTVEMFRDVGVPDEAVPDAMADHLVMTTLAIGNQDGVSFEAVRSVMFRMEAMLEDWRVGNPPFTEFNGVDENHDEFLIEDFLRTMVRFVWWFMWTLDDTFVEGFLKGGSREDAARGIVQDLCDRIRGNRTENSELSAVELGMIMDRIAAMHLEVRHGPDAMNVLRSEE